MICCENIVDITPLFFKNEKQGKKKTKKKKGK